MQRSGNWVSTYWALFMLFALFGLTWCSGDWRLPKPPFGVPVDLSRGGVVADFNIRVTRHWLYHFEIHFTYPKKDRNERERVRKIVGGLHEPTLVPTPVKLMIFKKQAQSEQMVYQKTVEDAATNSHSVDYFGKKLGDCDLPPGEYRFVLERDGPHSLYKYLTKLSGSSMMSQSAQERHDEKTKTKSFT